MMKLTNGSMLMANNVILGDWPPADWLGTAYLVFFWFLQLGFASKSPSASLTNGCRVDVCADDKSVLYVA